MKTITFTEDTAQDAKSLLKSTIGAAPEGGYTIDQVRTGIKILEKIDASADETISLEDAEYTFIRERVASIKWTVASQHVVAFYDAVLGAS